MAGFAGRVTRRAAIFGAGAAVGVVAARGIASRVPALPGDRIGGTPGEWLNDASGLSATPVHRHVVLGEDPGDALVAAIRAEMDEARANGRPVNIGAAQTVLALHYPGRRRQRGGGGVDERLARLDHRRLPDYALATHLAAGAGLVRQPPVAVEQPDGGGALVADGDAIGPEEMVEFGEGLALEEHRFDVDLQPFGLRGEPRAPSARGRLARRWRRRIRGLRVLHGRGAGPARGISVVAAFGHVALSLPMRGTE